MLAEATSRCRAPAAWIQGIRADMAALVWRDGARLGCSDHSRMRSYRLAAWSLPPGLRSSGRFLVYRPDRLPQLAPALTLRLGKVGHRLGLTQASQVGVGLPVPERLLHPFAHPNVLVARPFTPQRQVSGQPVARLPAQAGPFPGREAG